MTATIIPNMFPTAASSSATDNAGGDVVVLHPWSNDNCLHSLQQTSAAAYTPYAHQQQQDEQTQTQPQRQHIPMPRRVSLKKRVAFAVAVDIIPNASAAAPKVPADSPHEPEEEQLLWYNAQDLINFRQQARDLCRQMRGDHGLSTDAATTTMSRHSPSMSFCGQTRGLESRTCLERQRRKYLAVKCVVRAQTKLLDADRLAALCIKCTRWAAELAQREAQRDYQRAYGTDDTNDDDVNHINQLNANNKRVQEAPLDDIFRRVRQRVSA